MIFFTEPPLNHPHNTSHTTLNPHAPEFFPNIFTHFTNNYPFLSTPPPLYLYPPLSPPVISIFYHHHFIPTKNLCYSNMELPLLLPAPKPAEDPNPVVHDSGLTRENDPGSAVFRKFRKHKPNKLGTGTGMGAGSSFWVKKGVINHPVTLASNYPFGDSTSLMIRNIPVRFSRMELMELLDEHCRLENEKISADDEPVTEFDFLYLPIDFKTKGSMGYAFVNFTTWVGAAKLYSSWNGSQWDNCPYKTKKIRQISRAKHQGKQELKRHFESSVFICETDEYLPVEITPPRNGVNTDQTNLTTIGTRKSK